MCLGDRLLRLVPRQCSSAEGTPMQVRHTRGTNSTHTHTHTPADGCAVDESMMETFAAQAGQSSTPFDNGNNSLPVVRASPNRPAQPSGGSDPERNVEKVSTAVQCASHTPLAPLGRSPRTLLPITITSRSRLTRRSRDRLFSRPEGTLSRHLCSFDNSSCAQLGGTRDRRRGVRKRRLAAAKKPEQL